MFFGQTNKKWLSQKIKPELGKNHSEIFDKSWKEIFNNWFEYFSDRRSWKLIIIIIPAIFIIGTLINIEYLNIIEINEKTAKIIVDQRTANIAVITSLTLIVTGFLINNLAVKEPLAYHLLFKHSFLFPIIYLTLITIGCFFVISTLRDSIGSPYFIKAVITGTYLSLGILFVVGFLFRAIIRFTDYNTVGSLFHNELMKEARSNLRKILIRKYSLSHFKEEMQKRNVNKNDISLSLKELVTERSVNENSDTSSPGRFIQDINLNRLSKFISSINDPERLYYNPICISQEAPALSDFIWHEEVNFSKQKKQNLKRCILLSEKKPLMLDEYYKSYFATKIEEYTLKNNYGALENTLKSILELYELQMRHQNE